MNLKSRVIVIIGLGYVGLPLAIEFAKYRSVIGFDIKKARIDELSAGCDSTHELSMEEMGGAKFITFTSDFEFLKTASAAGEMVFIVTVPTPVDNSKRPNLMPLIKASEIVGKYCNLRVYSLPWCNRGNMRTGP